MGRIPLAIAVALAGLAVVTPTAPATIYPVTTQADEQDNLCSDGDCSLRDAVGRANVATNADVIQLPPGVGDHDLHG
jgi:CSLREA domain-containing protein